jgi:hypothetical protein
MREVAEAALAHLIGDRSEAHTGAREVHFLDLSNGEL